jgi:hypothetical protein
MGLAHPWRDGRQGTCTDRATSGQDWSRCDQHVAGLCGPTTVEQTDGADRFRPRPWRPAGRWQCRGGAAATCPLLLHNIQSAHRHARLQSEWALNWARRRLEDREPAAEYLALAHPSAPLPGSADSLTLPSNASELDRLFLYRFRNRAASSKGTACLVHRSRRNGSEHAAPIRPADAPTQILRLATSLAGP